MSEMLQNENISTLSLSAMAEKQLVSISKEGYDLDQFLGFLATLKKTKNLTGSGVKG
jgi:hypothetical protein